MLKKGLAALSLLLPVLAIGFFPSSASKNAECTQAGTSTQTPQDEKQSEVQGRVYQVWCGGIF